MAGIVGGLRKLRGAIAQIFNRSAETSAKASAEPANAPEVRHGQTSGPAGPPKLNHNPRRYKRAMLLTGGAGTQQEIASASAQFRGKPYSVVDLSHTGVAVERGELRDADFPDLSKPESIVLNVGMLEPFSVQATLARHSATVLAFEFVDVSTEGRLTIDRFLDPKMIGLNIRAVDRAFFSPGETFTLWFCGPRDTNFFLWMNSGRLDRAIIQLGDEQFTLAPSVGALVSVSRPGVRPTTLRDSVLFALDVALQVKNGGDAIAGLVRLLTDAADTLQSDAPPSGT